MTERWTSIPGFENYQVSDLGSVKRQNSLLKVRRHPKGYRTVSLSVNGRVYQRLIHRLVLEAFVGPCPKGHQARHLNGTRDDNRLVNLAWGTASENQMDRVEHGTSNRGEQHPQTRLTTNDVSSIRARYHSGGVTQDDLAKQYGVTRRTVGRIISRESWRYV